MLSKKIKRKTRRKSIKLLKITGIFLGIFAITLGILYLISPMHKGTLISPLSELKATVNGTQRVATDELKRLLQKNKVAFKEIREAKNNEFVVQLDPTGEVVFSSEKDLQRQISSLQVILTRLTMEGKAVVRLDLRYDKPVIVLK